jgi:hypothetical protein
MAHAQKSDFVFRRNGRVHLNRRERQFSRLLAAELCASAVIMLDTPCSEVVWRVLATHSIRQFPLHFASRASPCAITFQLNSTNCCNAKKMWIFPTQLMLYILYDSYNKHWKFSSIRFSRPVFLMDMHCFLCEVKVKVYVKFTLEQASNAQRRSVCIALLFH